MSTYPNQIYGHTANANLELAFLDHRLTPPVCPPVIPFIPQTSKMLHVPRTTTHKGVTRENIEPLTTKLLSPTMVLALWLISAQLTAQNKALINRKTSHATAHPALKMKHKANMP